MAVATKEKRPRTPAQIAHAQRLAQLAKERAAMHPPAPLEGEVLDSQDEVFKQLAEFAALMGDSAKKKADQKRIMDQVANLLNTLDPNAYADVLAHPVVEKLTGAVIKAKEADGSLAAGADLGKAIGKKPYTWDDVQPDVMEWVEYTPRRSVPVTWNGLTFYFQEDVTVRCPKCFVDIEEESRRNSRLAREHTNFMFRKTNDVSDRTILADGTGRVRGRFTGGEAGTRTGLDVDVRDADRPGFDAGDEGEGETA